MEMINDFFNEQNTSIPLFKFIFNLILSGLMALLLNYVYEVYGNSLSNRKKFGKNFLLITMTTMLIITVVKSSLALSLGLVGALSIIRFRTAVKEPEELGYMFLSIAIGLGLGANQTLITIVSFFIILSIIIFIKLSSEDRVSETNLYLNIQSEGENHIKIEKIIEIIKKNCHKIELNRLDETFDSLESAFLIEIQDFESINKSKDELMALDKNIKITFLDNKGLI